MGKKESRPDAIAAELEKLRGKQVDGKVNLGDAAYIKRALDEAAIKFMEEEGYSEDTTLTNTRIGLGLIICALAASAQFYPKKYPDNYWVLLFCVVCYGLASLAQNVIFGHVGGDLFFQSRMKMARYSEDYELSLGKRPTVWSQKVRPSKSLGRKVTEFFDTEGNLLENRFKPVVIDLLRQYEKPYKGK